jgi:hypothetical protein
MWNFIFVVVLLLIPISSAFSQEYADTNSTLSVSLNHQTTFVYHDSEGYVIIIGLIENNDPLSFVPNVVLHANFFDDFNSNSLEIIEGNSVLNMITPNGKSPFVIRSETPDVDIHPSVEYIGKYDCQFIGNKSELQHMCWIPEKRVIFH